MYCSGVDFIKKNIVWQEYSVVWINEMQCPSVQCNVVHCSVVKHNVVWVQTSVG